LPYFTYIHINLILNLMQKSIIFHLILILFLSISCKNDSADSNPDVTPVEGLIDSASAAAAITLPAPPLGLSTPPVPKQSMPTMPAPVVSKTTGQQGPLNPPHGQPGHRCDIPEGSPLNSAPKAATPSPAPAKQAPVQQVVTAPVTQPAAASGTAKMNPAHGEPGHRCDIAVGAPLPAQ